MEVKYVVVGKRVERWVRALACTARKRDIKSPLLRRKWTGAPDLDAPYKRTFSVVQVHLRSLVPPRPSTLCALSPSLPLSRLKFLLTQRF